MRILYIDADSLRPDHLGCYGYHRETSPHIDALAADGRRFANLYATDVPCLPSRTAFLAGRFGFHTGVINHGGRNADIRHRGARRSTNTANDGYRSLPTVLRQADHRTAFISPFPQRHGAWHTIDGFEEWIDTGERGFECADVIYPFAERWLEDHATEEDWYLHVNFWDPHAPYDTPIVYGNPFEDAPGPDWPDQATLDAQMESYGQFGAREPPVWDPSLPRQPDELATREELVQWIDGYDTGIRYMDDHIGKLLARLDEAGVLAETLIVLSADHGESQGERNIYGNHVTADDPPCNIPLIVSGPDIEPGVDEDFYYNIDLSATLADLAGGTVPDRWDGRSFAPSLTEGRPDGREYLVTTQGALSCERAVRWDDWILIRTYHDGLRPLDPVSLYNLAEDPHETTNLAQERPEKAREGIALLEDWKAKRKMEVIHDRAGGNPDATHALTDPMMEVLAEGGAYQAWYDMEHEDDHLADRYAAELREDGFADYADRVAEYQGFVPQDPEGYLAGESVW